MKTLLLILACNLHVKIATPPQEKTDSTYKAITIITDGAEPYSYSWSNSSTLSYCVFPKSNKSIYISISDANGCVAIDTFIIP